LSTPLAVPCGDKPFRTARGSCLIGSRHLAARSLALVLVAAAAGLSCSSASLPTEATVRRVIDGDTVELRDGRLVRYLGIDTPEVRYRVGERWVHDPEAFAVAAMDANRRLVEGRRVTLEYDVETRDRYGRLLAYVYVEGRMANAELLRLGLAQPLTMPPNVKYAETFLDLTHDARRHERGLWKDERSLQR